MASRTSHPRPTRPRRLPDLPEPEFPVKRRGTVRMNRSANLSRDRTRRQRRSWTEPAGSPYLRNAGSISGDRSHQSSLEAQEDDQSLAWSWVPPVLPRPMQMLQEALPNMVMALSTLSVVGIATLTPLGLPLWGAGVFIPTVLLGWFANPTLHPLWRRASVINLATMAAVFPTLVVRQSVLRIPFVDGGNGTLLAPMIATGAVILVLILLAAASAVLSQEDPEYAGVGFLPAALMVPFLAGQTDVLTLRSGLLICTGIFLTSALLTVVASMLPGAYPALITPMAIAAEFVLLTLVRETSIFPIGAGTAAKILFFVVVIVTVALSILIPILSHWIRQVTRIAQFDPRAASGGMRT